MDFILFTPVINLEQLEYARIYSQNIARGQINNVRVYKIGTKKRSKFAPFTRSHSE